MSRGYRIQMDPVQVVRGTAAGADQVRLGVELLPILPEEDMRGLVRQTLRERGWVHGADGTLEKDLGGGAVATLAKDGKSVVVRLTLERQVEGSGRTAGEAEQQMEVRRQRAEQEVRERATRELARVEPAARKELDEAMQKIYVEALKKKAQQMGQVESMQETTSADGSLEIVIKVKA